MKKIFIDAGANNSCSARIFRKTQDPNIEYTIYSFEIEPEFVNNFVDIPKLIFINKAVWIKDGYINFYRDIYDHRKAGGSLLKEKTSGKLNKDEPIRVESIDFSKWVKHTFSKSDYIILKMDIEGAEYKVISKMMTEGSFDYINELLIEWHWYKIGMDEKQHKKFIEKISIPMKKWAGIENAKRILGSDYLNKE